MISEHVTCDISINNTQRLWVNTEQEYKKSESDYVSPNDVYQMLSLAMSGESATSYINDTCKYVRIENGKILVDLVIYVWPENLDLQYSLSATLGGISDGEYVEIFKSEDIIFDNESRKNIGYIFSGEFYNQMPVLLPDGSLSPEIDAINSDWLFKFPTSVYAVLRANGIAKGYKHTVTMEFNKINDNPLVAYKLTGWATAGLSFNRSKYPPILNSGAVEGIVRVDFSSHLLGNVKLNGSHIGYFNPLADFVSDYFTLSKDALDSIVDGGYFEFKIVRDTSYDPAIGSDYQISGIKNEVMVSWQEDGGKFSNIISLDIPPCVDDLLTMCWEGNKSPSWYLTINDDNKDEFLNVYYSTCSGKAIAEHWETK